MDTPAPLPRKPKTLKERKWLKLYLELGNATEAAMRVYDCKDRDSASNIGWENVRKLDFAELMEEGGLTDQYLHQKLQEGLESKKQLASNPVFKKDAPTSQSAHEMPAALNGNFIEVPDMAVRHKYLETAFKVKGRVVDRKDITSDGEKLEGIEVIIVEDKQQDE